MSKDQQFTKEQLDRFEKFIFRMILENKFAKSPKSVGDLSSDIIEVMFDKKNGTQKNLQKQCEKLVANLQKHVDKELKRSSSIFPDVNIEIYGVDSLINRMHSSIAEHKPSYNLIVRFFETILSYIADTTKSREEKFKDIFSRNVQNFEDRLLAWSVSNTKKIDDLDPIAWATINNKLINGKDPIAWAAINNKKILWLDPIIWAIDNNKRIDGKNPIVWALDNNKRIDGKDPLDFAIANNKQVDGKDSIVWAIKNNKPIDGKDSIAWAIENNKRIKGKDPLDFAIANNKRVDGKDSIVWAIENNKPIRGKHPLAWTASNNKQVDGKDPIVWALENKRKISGINPILWAAEHNIKINNQTPLEYANSNPSMVDQTVLKKVKLIENNRAVLDLYEDRRVAEHSEFTMKGAKTAGVSEGYKATRDKDGHMFMFKKFHYSSFLSRDQIFDNLSFVNEFVMGPFYKRWLYNASPSVELVSSDKTKERHLRSKFLHDFQTVSEFTNSTDPGSIGTKNLVKLKAIKGAEKLFAGIVVGGEIDRHAGNIGIMTSDTEMLCKIDHGQSAVNGYTDPYIMWKNFAYYMNEMGYSKALTIDVEKFRESIEEMCKTSDYEIERFVQARLAILEKAGIPFSNITLMKCIDDSLHKKKLLDVKFNDKESVEKHYIKFLKDQRDVSLKFCKILSVIEKMDMPPEWKKGQWIADIGGKDPVQWAIGKNVKIANTEPTKWNDLQNKKNVVNPPLGNNNGLTI